MDYTVGFGQKWRLVRDELMKLSSDAMVIVADARDSLLNLPNVIEQSSLVSDLISEVKKSFNAITEDRQEAVVFGTEFTCCVFALTHVKPTDYFDETGTKRVKRSCSSGKDGCGWKGSINAMPWSDFQLRLAKERTGGVEVADAYLNGGLAMGTAKNLLNIIDLADLEDDEDDQAVFTGLMYRRPDLIMLDYANEIFGTARFALGMKHGGCVFEKSLEKGNLQHKEIKSTPLLLHTPNHFYECLDGMAAMLGEERSQGMKELTKAARPIFVVDGPSRKLQDYTVTIIQPGPIPQLWSPTTLASLVADGANQAFDFMNGGDRHTFLFHGESLLSSDDELMLTINSAMVLFTDGTAGVSVNVPFSDLLGSAGVMDFALGSGTLHLVDVTDVHFSIPNGDGMDTFLYQGSGLGIADSELNVAIDDASVTLTNPTSWSSVEISFVDLIGGSDNMSVSIGSGMIETTRIWVAHAGGYGVMA